MSCCLIRSAAGEKIGVGVGVATKELALPVNKFVRGEADQQEAAEAGDGVLCEAGARVHLR
jgi:hypothetical protein